MPLCRRRYCIPFRNATAKTEVSVSTFAKSTKITWLPQQRPLGDFKTNVRLIIPIDMSIKVANLVRICQARSEIIGRICSILQFCDASTKIKRFFYGCSALNLTKFVHDVATFNALLSSHRRSGVPIRFGMAVRN